MCAERFSQNISCIEKHEDRAHYTSVLNIQVETLYSQHLTVASSSDQSNIGQDACRQDVSFHHQHHRDNCDNC